MPPSVFDPISSFYYLRALTLTVGEPVYVTIFDSKKVWNVEVQVLRKERGNPSDRHIRYHCGETEYEVRRDILPERRDIHMAYR